MGDGQNLKRVLEEKGMNIRKYLRLPELRHPPCIQSLIGILISDMTGRLE